MSKFFINRPIVAMVISIFMVILGVVAVGAFLAMMLFQARAGVPTAVPVAVIFIASAASSLLPASRHMMEAQPSGEMTE